MPAGPLPSTLSPMSSMDDLRAVVSRMDELEQLRTRRDDLIAQAHVDRYTWDEIAEATGLSRQACYNARFRALKEGFEPLPFDR